MRLSTAYRYKFLKDYRIGVPELLSEVSYQGNIIFNESDLRKSIGWVPDSLFNQIGQDIDGEASFDQSGQSVSINSVGDRVAIGAIGNDGNGSNSGHTRIYQLSGSTWTQLGQDIDGEVAGDISGYSVSMNSVGDRVAIGATGNDNNGSNSGHTRIYQLSGSTWTQLGQDIDGEAVSDRSGFSVSMNSVGDRVAIGATLNDGNGSNSGHTRIYELSGSTWTQLGQDIDGEAADDQSGYSVSMNAAGDRVAIGANLNDGNGNNSGSVRIFNLIPSLLDKPFTSFNDENINAIRPVWKYARNLNILGGWYDNFNKQFITNLEETNLSASINSDRFTSKPNYKAYKWIEIATKKNTNISLSSMQLSSIYFKLTGFAPKATTAPIIKWTQDDNVVSQNQIYNNIFFNVAPNFSTLSTQNVDDLFINYTPEIQSLSAIRNWKIGNVNKYFTQNITLDEYDSSSSILYSISAYSDKNASPTAGLIAGNTPTIYAASSGFFEFAKKSTFSLRSRLTSVTPLTSTRRLFTVQNRTAGIFTRNPQMWCADLTDQLTALVVQKLGASVFSYGGTLITPRHLLYVQHAFPRTERVRFVKSDSTVISAAPLGSADGVTFRSDFPIRSLSSVDIEYEDIGIVVLDRDVSLSGIHVMPIAAITPTERLILRSQYIPTLVCSQAPGRTTSSTNPNPVSASDIQMTISSSNFGNIGTAWGNISANPFYYWDITAGGYKIWDGDSGNAHMLFCNDKLYIYSTTKWSFTADGAIVSALSGAINYLIEKADQAAGINTGLKPTYYTIDQIANR